MKVIIIGCGRLGSGMARDLSRRGNDVTVIDNNPLAFERLGTGLKINTITGIGFDRSVLTQAGIETADSLAAVTASDEANVVAARIAKMVFRVPRVAARVYDPRKADIYRRLGIPTISPVAITAARMSDLLTFSNLNTLIRLGTGEVSIIEVEVSDLLTGRIVEEIGLPGKALVISITRMGKSFLPSAKTELEYGDVIHLAVMGEDTDRIASLFGIGRRKDENIDYWRRQGRVVYCRLPAEAGTHGGCDRRTPRGNWNGCILRLARRTSSWEAAPTRWCWNPPEFIRWMWWRL